MLIRCLSLAIPAALLCVSTGCNDQFNPNGPYSETLVVYAVLSSPGTVQYVRVYSTYPPPGDLNYAPGDNQVTDAVVTVTQGNTTYQFTPTTVPRRDTSHYHSSIVAYVAHNFSLTPNASYALTVTSPSHGSASANATALYDAGIALPLPGAVQNPDLGTDIQVIVTPGVTTAAYVVRFFLDFRAVSTIESTGVRVEVPSGFQSPPVSGQYVYPRPVARGNGIPAPNLGDEIYLFSAGTYKDFLSHLKQQFPTDTLQFQDAVFTVTQLDQSLFAYYNVINGFPDQVSIRLEVPDYTNISNGLGVFGASTVDSVKFGVSFVEK